jgi:excisionase family DNA binding protein
VTSGPDLRHDVWLTLPEVARELGVSVTKVRQLVRDHELAMVRRPGSREPEIPAAFLQDGAVVKGLAGTLTLLVDHGFDDEEAVDWLLTPDDSLPGAPVDALRANRGREVHRRAQVIT